MPEFVWRAAGVSGKVEHGRLSAASTAAALRQLREQGLTPLSLDDASQPGAAEALSLAGVSPAAGGGAGAGLTGVRPPRARKVKGPVTAPDVLALTSELAIMLRAGLALDNALRVLIDMGHKPSVAALMQGVLDAVKGGTPLSRALAQHRSLFGDFYINMVRSGEASGQMSAVLDRLVEHMERQRALRESVVSATIYPAILLAVAVLSLIAMLGFVVPQFEKLFTDMGDALPLPTRIVMGMGQAFTQYGLLIGLLLAGAGVLVARWAKSPAGRRWWQARLLRLPLVGPLALKYQITLFSRSLGTLLGNGVPMLTALHIATETVGNTVLQQALAGLVGPRVLNQLGGAKSKTAGVQIADLDKSLELFKLDAGRYPTTEEGLESLVKRPGTVNGWTGPYLKGGVPTDPWGHAYRYASPGPNGGIEILSLGADGAPGGEGENADIRNSR